MGFVAVVVVASADRAEAKRKLQLNFPFQILLLLAALIFLSPKTLHSTIPEIYKYSHILLFLQESMLSANSIYVYICILYVYQYIMYF